MTTLDWTRVNNDTNGNPRYVVHFLSLLSDYEKGDKFENYLDRISNMYAFALNRARKLGGKKFHNKQYGGGIAFQSYYIEDTEQGIIDLINEESEVIA